MAPRVLPETLLVAREAALRQADRQRLAFLVDQRHEQAAARFAVDHDDARHGASEPGEAFPVPDIGPAHRPVHQDPLKPEAALVEDQARQAVAAREAGARASQEEKKRSLT